MFPTKSIRVLEDYSAVRWQWWGVWTRLCSLRVESYEVLFAWGVYKRKKMLWQCCKDWWEYWGLQSKNSGQNLSIVGALLLWLGLRWLKWKDIWTDSICDCKGEWLRGCILACMCSCINTGRFDFEWLIWAVTSWRLTPWDEIETGAGLMQRERESAATKAGWLLTIGMVVSTTSLPADESDGIAGWLLGLGEGDHLVLLLGVAGDWWRMLDWMMFRSQQDVFWILSLFAVCD